MRAVVFVNGKIGSLAPIREAICPDDTIVSVDGGIRHLRELGMTPHIIIGDMDSIDRDLLQQIRKKGVEILYFPPAKDETDLELALNMLEERGYTDCLLVAALGGRIDQTLANIWLLAERHHSDFKITADDGCEKVEVIFNNIKLTGSRGDTVSLIPFAGPVTGITTEGLQYPLENETLFPEKTRGLSNVMQGEQARIHIKSGKLICVYRREIFCEKEKNET